MPSINSAKFIDLLLQRRYHPPKLVAVGILTLILGWSASRVSFQFEFEELFPKGNEDLTFYSEHVSRFGYDNDYLTVVIHPEETIYDSTFLSIVQELAQELRSLTYVDDVFSPLQIPRLEKTPFGTTAFKLLDDPHTYDSDRAFIEADPLLSKLIPTNFLALVLHHEHLDNIAGAAFYEAFTTVVDKYNLPYRSIGRIPGEQAFLTLIREDFLVFLLGSLSVCALVLWRICRRVSLTVMPLLVSGLTLLWTFGVMGLLGLPITIMTSLLPPIILFVSSSDSIHLISALRNSSDRRQAMAKVFFPTFMTSITTTAGFFSLMVLPVGPLQALGFLAGTGTLLAFALTYLLAPNFPGNYRPESKMDYRTVERYASWLWRWEQPIVFVTLLLTLAGAYFTSRLEVDAHLLGDLPPSSSLRKDFIWADEHLGGSKPWEIALSVVAEDGSWWDLEVQREVQKITEYVENALGASQVISSSHVVQYANYIEDSEFALPKNIGTRLLTRAKRLLHELRVPIVSDDQRHGRISALIPEWGSEETQQRNALLAAFIDEQVDSEVVSYRLTGSTFMIDKSHEILARDIMLSLLLAVAMVSLVLGLYFRSIKTAFIALIPNLVPLLIIGGLIYAMGLPIQLSTSIIFALIFGIVVDDSIHFLATYRNAAGQSPEERSLYAMNTAGRGIINTTLVLVSGFGILIFSQFGATHYLGLFLCLSLFIALIVDFTLLPILLRWTQLKGRRTSQTRNRH